MRFIPRRRSPEHRDPFTQAIVSLPVGHVRNDRPRPQPHGWDGVESIIEVLPEHTERIAGIDGYSHIIVVFYMDIAADAPEKPEMVTMPSGNRYGIMATRSQLRPNHLGVSVVPLLGLQGSVLRVRGLDAIDGSAVLDIKPYLPQYDAVAGATIPGL